MEERKIIDKMDNKKLLLIYILGIISLIIVIFSTIFAIINISNNNIISGIRIKGIDVSGLSRDEVKSKLKLIYEEKMHQEILLEYKDYCTTITPELIEVDYRISEAIEQASLIGRRSNIIKNNYDILFALICKKNININMTFNEEIINKIIDNIQANLPDGVLEPDYYIENDKLIIIKGKEGLKIDSKKLIEEIKEDLETIDTNQIYIEIPTFTEKPREIDIDKVYKEVHKEAQDAHYTTNPFTLYPEIEGIDFNLEEAKSILEEDKEQYEIQLQVTKPNVTTAQIVTEAFPDLLSSFTTRYDASNEDRSKNLELACEKLNDKVVLSGEIFSYNKTLGERTIAAGYKNAKVYENGQVVDGIGGGICQISSTLYNSVLMANMDIVERKNHMFITSYVPSGRDATVAYGSVDFKFKNTRKYAVKIKAECSNGVATVSIYGIREENEYKVSFNTTTISIIPYTVKYEDDNTLGTGQEKVIQQGSNGAITETYIVKSLNGKVVSNELLSKDTYSAMQKIIARGTK